MGDVQRARGALRPVSAVESSRVMPPGGGGIMRPASAGMWRGKPTVYVTNAAKALGSESGVSVGSVSDSVGQRGVIHRVHEGDSGGKVGLPAAHSRTSSVASSSKSRTRKGGADVWIFGPLSSGGGRGKEGKGGSTSRSATSTADAGRDGDGGIRQQRMFKLGRLGSEADRLALQQMENALVAAAARGGKTGARFLESSDRLGRKYNSTAMRCLQMGEHAQALELLQSAESLIAECNADPALDGLKGLTYNNLGCYFRREGMPMEALKWLRQAHDIEQRVGRSGAARASTFLNLCAVYSLLGKHLDALGCAEEALANMRVALRDADEPQGGAAVPGMERVDQASMVAIAYHNIAVEQEYLARYADAAASYRKALSVAERQCGPKSQLVAKIRFALAAATNAAQAADEEQRARRAPRAARYSGGDSDSEAPLTTTTAPGSDAGSQQLAAPTPPPAARPPGAADAGAGRPRGRRTEGDDARRRVPEAGAGRDASPPRSPGGSSGRERARLRPLSASRLPGGGAHLAAPPAGAAAAAAPETGGRGEGGGGGAGRAARRHSRKTARPRTAGRERLGDVEREELMAMTDPSESEPPPPLPPPSQ